MALQLRAKRPVITKLTGALVAVAALLVQPFGALPIPVASAASPSDVWITSAMPNPAGTGTDATGEYIVLENQTTTAVNLAGWTISDNGSSFNLSGSIQANSTYKLCAESDAATSTALPCDGEWPSMSLRNTDGETLTLREGVVIIDQVAYTSTSDGDPVNFSSHTVAPVVSSLNPEEFVTNEGSYKGVSVGFNASNFGDVSDVRVVMTRADGTTVTKVANAGVRNLLSNQASPVKITAPFVIQAGTFTEASDEEYWQAATVASWTANTRPTSVEISVTDQSGTKTTLNTGFSEPNGWVYASLLPFAPGAPVIYTVSGSTTAVENDAKKWFFNRDTSTSTPYEFNTDAAATGTGSLYVKPIGANAKDKFIGEYFVASKLDDTGSILFDYRLGDSVAASKANQIYANVYVNFSSTEGYGDCVYNVVATNGAAGWHTLTFNPNENYSVRSRTATPCPAKPSDLAATAYLRAISLNVGDTNINDLGVEAYLDNVRVETVAETSVYNFDPAPVDSTGPTVSEVSPSNGSYKNADFVASVDATDESGVKKIALYVIDTETGLKVKEYAMTAPVSGDTWKANVKLADIGGDGQYDLRFRAVDTLNNVTYLNNRGGSFVIDVDSSKPSGLSLKLADGRDVQGASVNGTQTFVFTQSEANPQRIYIEYMEKDSSGVWRKKIGKEVLSDNRAELVVDTRSFADGLHQVKVSTRDEAGNASGLTAQFTVDNGTPTVTVKDGYSGDKNQAIFSSLSFKLYDKYNVDKLTLNGVAKNLTDSQWSDLNGVKPGAFGAIEGVNELVVFDVAGNQTVYEFVLDTKLPTASIQNPTDGQVLEGTVPVTITAKDETKLAAYSYRIKDIATGNVKVVEEVVTDGSAADGQTVFSWNTKAFDNGEYYVYVSARDAAGNRSEERFNVTVANSGPAVTVLSPVANQAVDESVDVSFSATDSAELGAYCVKLNGGSCVPNGYRYQPNGSQVYTVVVDTGALTEGEHVVTVRVTDRVGNVTETDTTILVQREGNEPDDGGSVFIPPVLDGENPPVNNTETGDQESTGGSSNTTGGAASGASNNSFTPTQQIAALPNFIAAVNNGVGISSSQVADNDTQDTAPSEAGILGTSTTESESDGDVAGASDEAGWSIADMAWYWWVVAVLGAIGAWLLLAAGIRRIRGTNV